MIGIQTHISSVRAGSNIGQLSEDMLRSLEHVVVDVLPAKAGGLGAESGWSLRRNKRVDVRWKEEGGAQGGIE